MRGKECTEPADTVTRGEAEKEGPGGQDRDPRSEDCTVSARALRGAHEGPIGCLQGFLYFVFFTSRRGERPKTTVACY